MNIMNCMVVCYALSGLALINCVVKMNEIKQDENTMQNVYCNRCGFETARKVYDGETETCPYHQEISYSDDGEVSFRYDEFNQDGEEW